MKTAILLVTLFVAPLVAQDIPLRELPDVSQKNSLFTPVSATSPDGVAAIRASGAYGWNIAPVIGKNWNNSQKSLLLAIEVVGSDLTPSAAVFVIDDKTFVVQSADWRTDSRQNLLTIVEKEGLVRKIAGAQAVSVTVFAPAPVTATFQRKDLDVFRAMVHIYDTDAMHLATTESRAALDNLPQAPVGLTMPPSSEATGRMKVTVVANESTTTPYYWEADGRVSVTCYGNTCNGYYTAPRAGTQQIEGAVLKLQRADSSIVVVRCIAKVNVFSSTMSALDAMSVGDPNAPTVYRDCRAPIPDEVVDANFHHKTVKLTWHFDGAPHSDSETYEVVGVLQPARE